MPKAVGSAAASWPGTVRETIGSTCPACCNDAVAGADTTYFPWDATGSRWRCPSDVTSVGHVSGGDADLVAWPGRWSAATGGEQIEVGRSVGVDVSEECSAEVESSHLQKHRWRRRRVIR